MLFQLVLTKFSKVNCVYQEFRSRDEVMQICILKIEPELRFCPVLLSYLVVFSHVCHVDQNEAEASHYNNNNKNVLPVELWNELNINGELE